MKIVIEGSEYVGKTTVSKLLEDVGYTRFVQPGNEHIRRFIKEDLLKGEFDEKTMALAQAADRHWQENNKYDIETDYIIDRSVISSLIIQTKELPLGFVAALNESIDMPDVVFWLRISDNELKRRMGKRKLKDVYDEKAFELKKRYEVMMPEIRKKVNHFYEIYCDRKSPEEVALEIDETISSLKKQTIVEKCTQKIKEIFGAEINRYEKNIMNWFEEDN